VGGSRQISIKHGDNTPEVLLKPFREKVRCTTDVYDPPRNLVGMDLFLVRVLEEFLSNALSIQTKVHKLVPHQLTIWLAVKVVLNVADRVSNYEQL